MIHLPPPAVPEREEQERGHSFAVKSIMRRYRVRSHHMGRIKTGKPQYAVFSGKGKAVRIVFGPDDYSVAVDTCEALITRDLLEYFGACDA